MIDKLNRALNTTLQDPEIREKLLAQGSEAVGGTPEALGKTVDAELREVGQAGQGRQHQGGMR